MSKQQNPSLVLNSHMRAGRALHSALLFCGERLVEQQKYKGRWNVRDLGLKRFKYKDVELSTVLLCCIDSNFGPEVFVSDGNVALGPLNLDREVRNTIKAHGAFTLSDGLVGLQEMLNGVTPQCVEVDDWSVHPAGRYVVLKTETAVATTYFAAAETHVCVRDCDKLSLFQERGNPLDIVLFKGITGRAAIVMPLRLSS